MSTAGGKNKDPQVKLVVQQCLSARLALPDGTEAAIGRGMVVFVCFLRDADEERAVRAAETACAVKLCEREVAEHKSDSTEEVNKELSLSDHRRYCRVIIGQ